tara:strand:- start:152 stop:1885 length:1734 start_codon:yes stop_codon:yes gene_type:complete
MNLLNEHIRLPPDVKARIYNEEYVRVVLGIKVPLNESYPYSYELQEKILEEQLLLEGFFSDFKKLGGDAKNAALALRYIMQDSSRLQEYMGLIKAELEGAYDSLTEFLETILESIDGLSSKVAKTLKKVSEWATDLLEKVNTFVQDALSGDGWKGAMILSGALVGIGFIWSKLEGPAPKILDALSKLSETVTEATLSMSMSYHLFEGEDAPDDSKEDSKVEKIVGVIKKLLFGAVKEIGARALKGLAVETIGAALTGGISAAFKALKAVYGGSKILFQFLGGPLEKFVSKIKDPEEEVEEAEAGEDDPTESKNESLLREYMRELLAEDAMGFVHDLAASSEDFGEPGEMFFGGNPGKGGGRAIKRAFADNADYGFLDSLDTIHWTGDLEGLQGLAGKSKDELSATMTLPGENFDALLDYGLWIKGRITLAANDMDKLYTGHYDSGRRRPSQVHRDKSSGRNKLPTVSKDYSRYGQLKRGNEFHEKMAEDIPYVLDQSTWDLQVAGTNEALVDNWKPVGIILTRGDEINTVSGLEYVEGTQEDIEEFTLGITKQILLTALALGVPIYDQQRELLWSPE